MKKGKSFKSILTLALACSFYLLLEESIADQPSNSLEFSIPVEIEDGELAEMRGRYASSGQVVYFGVQMTSQWSTSSGQNLGVGMSMGVPIRKIYEGVSKPEFINKITYSGTRQNDDVEKDRQQRSGDNSQIRAAQQQVGRVRAVDNIANDGGSVRVRQEPQQFEARESGLDSASPNNSTVRVDGFKQGKGVVQRIHVAGVGNRIDNSADMDIKVHASDDLDNLDGSASQFQSIPEGPLNDSDTVVLNGFAGVSGTQTVVTESGAVLTSHVKDNGLGISIEIPGQGKITQQVGGGNLNEFIGILQSVQLTGDLQRIQNLLDVQAVFQAPKDFVPKQHLAPALKSLRYLPLTR